jgi:hypothetical protein
MLTNNMIESTSCFQNVIEIRDIDVYVVVCPKFLANYYTSFNLNLMLLKGDEASGHT